jgi:hypothetical protein
MAMNIYLEKIAEVKIRKDVTLGKVQKPEPITAPGSKLIHGAKTLLNRALLKAAEEQESHKKDIINTAVIGGLGGVGTLATNKIMKASPNVFRETSKLHSAKVMALGTGIGLAADYAGLKLNKAINKHVE